MEVAHVGAIQMEAADSEQRGAVTGKLALCTGARFFHRSLNHLQQSLVSERPPGYSQSLRHLYLYRRATLRSHHEEQIGGSLHSGLIEHYTVPNVLQERSRS